MPFFRLVFIVILLSVMSAMLLADGDRTRPLALPSTRPAFIIGVWSQPAGDIGRWKARGINTMLNYESQGHSVSMDDYTSACAKAGVFLIRQPRAGQAIFDDAHEECLLAWMHNDEPDIKKPAVDPLDLLNDYTRMKWVDPDRPIFLNFSGGNVLFKKIPKSFYVGYMKAADWISNDFYPVSGWAHPDWLAKVGETCDVLREWSGGKPQFAFIETAPLHLPWRDFRGVSSDELRGQIWDAVIHGVKGVVYFPQTGAAGGVPFHYDATPGEVVQEITEQNQRLAAFGSILCQPANPYPVEVSVNVPLEATWRKTSDGITYLIILNLSPDHLRHQIIKINRATFVRIVDADIPDRILIIDNNTFTDDFRPFQVRIYNLGEMILGTK